MATATATRGIGTYLSASTFSTNETFSNGWAMNPGHIRNDYYNTKEYNAVAIAYTFGTISGTIASATLTVPISLSVQVGKGSIYAILSTTAPSTSDTEAWRFGPTTGKISSEISVAAPVTSLKFTITSGTALSGKTIYMYLYDHNNGTGSSVATNAVKLSSTAPGNASLTYYTSHKLTITQATGSTLTVARTASSAGGSIANLSNGATIYSGDTLKVTFSASTGYSVTCKYGSTSISSGGTFTVSGDVTVATTATKLKYTLTISQGANTTLTVKNGSTTLSSGASVEYGTVLTVTYSASTGYTASCKYGSTSINSGGTFTMTAATTVATTATKNKYTLTISQGANTTLTVKNGSTTLSSGASVEYGTTLTVTYSASTGYTASCKYGSTAISSGGTFTMPASNTTVTSTATINTYAVTISQGANTTLTVKNGSTTITSGTKVNYGTVLTITHSGATGYTSSCKAGSTTISSGGTYTVTAAVTITSTATINSYTLTISPGANTSLTVKNSSGTTLASGAKVNYGTVLTVTFSASTGYNATCKYGNTSISSGGTFTMTAATTVATTATLKTYTLTISQAANSTVKVTRSGTALTNGATVSHFDVLTVTFSASTGYNASCMVNSSSINSGATYTVSGAVTVATTVALKEYKLTIDTVEHCTITVTRGGVALNNGATIYHFDALAIAITPATGYGLVSRSPEGDISSVTGNVTVTAVVSPMATVHIDNGSGIDGYLIYIDEGGVWTLYQAYVDNGAGWDPYY